MENERENALRERVIFLATDIAPGGRGTYKYLEDQTGIPANRWKNVILKRQMPTLVMLMSLMDFRGQYAEWLLTGNEPTHGEAPSYERWEGFLKYREWAQEHKDDASIFAGRTPE